MARRVLLDYAGACNHAINRGNCRRPVFTGRGGPESFACCLDEDGSSGWSMRM